METDEILEVIEIQLQEMNETERKPIGQRIAEMRAVVNLLAKLVLAQSNVGKSCTCRDSELEYHDIIQKYCRKCESPIIK